MAQWLLPPGILVVLIGIGTCFSTKRWGKVLLVFAAASLWLLATEPVRDALVAPLENHYPPFSESMLKGYAAIVVLGGGRNEMAPEYGGADALSDASLQRIAYAASLAKQTGLDVYASGGMPLANQSGATRAEGEIMRQWLLDAANLAPERVHAEVKSRTTWENAAMMATTLSGHGVEQVVLVTSATHMRRAQWSFFRAGLKAVPAPCAYLQKFTPYDARSFMPSFKAFNDSSTALHEYLGLLWYRLRY